MPIVKTLNVDGQNIEIADAKARQDYINVSQRVTSVESKANANSSSISATKQSVTQNTNDISVLKFGNAPNFQKTILIGDSFLSGTKATNPSLDNWGNQLKKYIKGEFKAFPSGGGGFITSGAAGTFNQLVSVGGSAYSAFTNRNEVTAVVVVGGINDGNGIIDTFYTAVKTFINTAKNSFPNAQIYIAYNPTVAPTLPCQQMFGLIQACIDMGIPTPLYSFGWLWEGRDSYNSGDNIHPNTKGYNIMGSILATWLKTGNEVVPIRTTANSFGGLTWYFTFDRENLYIRVVGTTDRNLSGNILSGMAKSLTPANEINLTSDIPDLNNLVLKDGNLAIGGSISTSRLIYFNNWTIPKTSLLPNMFKNH